MKSQMPERHTSRDHSEFRAEGQRFGWQSGKKVVATAFPGESPMLPGLRRHELPVGLLDDPGGSSLCSRCRSDVIYRGHLHLLSCMHRIPTRRMPRHRPHHGGVSIEQAFSPR